MILAALSATGLTTTNAELPIGESFSFICELANVQIDTFVDNDNDIDVTGDPVGGGDMTMDLDDTEVLFW